MSRRLPAMYQRSTQAPREGVCLICIVQHSEGEPHLSATVSAGGRLLRRTFPLTTYVESLCEISLWLEELKREHTSTQDFVFP